TELAVVGVDVRGSERLACLAVPRSDRETARSSLRRAIDELPFGQRPTIVHLYDAPLPRTATRKVKREEVRAILRRMIAATTRSDDATASPVAVAIAGVRGS